MALIKCLECNNAVSDLASSCPNCGAPVKAQPELPKSLPTVPPSRSDKSRAVSFLLSLGILFLPFIFAWFTLRRGYSKRAKFLAFSWLGVILIFTFMGEQQQSNTSNEISNGSNNPKSKAVDKNLADSKNLKNTLTKSDLENVSIIFSETDTQRIARMMTGISDRNVLYVGRESSIVVADFRIQNKNSFGVKDIDILCSWYGTSGTGLGNKKLTIFSYAWPNLHQDIKGFNFGFVDSQTSIFKCEIVGFDKFMP